MLYNKKHMEYLVSVVIPNYNGETLLKKNISHLLELVVAEKIVKDIIIVDDGSLDNSVAYLHKVQKDNPLYPLKILTHKKNKGFSSTINDGVVIAQGHIVYLLNTDVMPQKGFLRSLLVHFENPQIFAVGSMDKSIEGDSVVLRGRGLGAWKKGFFIHRRGEVDKSNTLWVSGGSGAFRKSMWDMLGGFREIYNPFYWEDIDLSYRALKSGMDIVFEKTSVVIHEHSKGAVKSNYTDFNVKSIAYRNQFFFLWTTITDTDYLSSHFLFLPYHMVKAFMRGDLAFFNGFLNALFNLTVAFSTRKRNRRSFIKSDKEILDRYRS